MRILSNKLLEIKDERLSFFTPAGEVKALNGVSFTMNEGEVLGIVGESGSGKSVTAYSIMGLTAYPGRLVGGTIGFNGHEIEKMTEKTEDSDNWDLTLFTCTTGGRARCAVRCVRTGYPVLTTETAE